MNKKYLSLIILIVSNNIINAEDLIQIYNDALFNDSNIKAAQYNLKSNLENTIQTKSNFKPNINLNGGLRYNNTDFDNYNSNNYSVEVTQKIYDKPNWIGLEQANLNDKKNILLFEQERQNLIEKTINYYLTVLENKEILKTVNQQKESVYARLEQIKAKYKLGVSTVVDLNDAQAKYDTILVEYLSAQTDLENSIEDLELLTSKNINKINILSQDYPIVDVIKNETIENFANKKFNSNINLRIKEIDTKISQKEINKSKAESLPKVNINGSYNYQDNQNESTDSSYIGISISMPLYTGGLNSSKERKSYFELEKLQHEKNYLVKTTKNDIKSTLRDIRVNIINVNALQQTINSNKKAFEATEAGYKLGTRNIVELLESEDSLFNAQLNYKKNIYNYIKNKVSLKRKIGQLSLEDLKSINNYLIEEEKII